MDKNTVDEIFKVVYDYVNRGQLIHEVGISKIVNAIARRNNLSDFLEGVSLEEKRKNKKDGNEIVYGSYLKYRHNITLYMENIIDFINSYDVIDMSDEEKILFANLELLSTLLHEVMHAKDRTEFMNKTPNDLKNLLYLSTDFDLLRRGYVQKYYNLSIGRLHMFRIVSQRKKLYNKTYNLNPCERLANIKSYETIVDQIKPLAKGKYDRIVNLEYYRYLSYLLAGYETYSSEYTCPTDQYLHEVKLDKIWKKLGFYNPNKIEMVTDIKKRYSLKDRIEYGLPVSEDELDIIRKRMDTIKKRLVG